MPEPEEIAAIVLAAGSSSRFGSDKLLHPVTLRGVTLPLAAHSLLPWLEVFGHTTVVVKPGSEAFCSAISTALAAWGTSTIRWLVCRHSACGIAASLACGVHANRESAGCLIGLADMPSLPSAAITGVRNALLAGADLAAPSCNGRRGHPVGFASHYYEELQTLQGDTGARRLLERDASNLVLIRTDSHGIYADIDVPADLQSL